MLEKLDFIEDKYKELALMCADPAVIADQANWQKYAKEMGEMEPIYARADEVSIKEAGGVLAGRFMILYLT